MRYKGIKGKLWKLVSEFIRRRDNYVCVTCGRSREQGFQMQAGHFMPVGIVGSNNRLSWDEENIYCQCARCNGPGQGEQVMMAAHIQRVHGKSKVEELRTRARQIDKVTDWNALIDYYKSK